MDESQVSLEKSRTETLFDMVPAPTVGDVYRLIPPSGGVTKEMYRIGVGGKYQFERLADWALGRQPRDETDKAIIEQFVAEMDAFETGLRGLLTNDDLLALLLKDRDEISREMVIDCLPNLDEPIRERIVGIVFDGVDPSISRLCEMGEDSEEVRMILAAQETGLLFTIRGNPGRSPMVFVHGLGEGLGELLKPQAEAVDRGKYLIHAFWVTQTLWRQFFPGFSEFPEVKWLEMYDADHQYATNAKPFCSSNGRWNYEVRRIDLESAVGLGETRFPGIYDQVTESSSRVWITRKVDDIRVLSHEWAHAVFDDLVYDKKGVMRKKIVNDSVHEAFTEGFAVLMEYLTLKVMQENPEKFGLSPAELEMLQKQREKRMDKLDGKDGGKVNHYTEGLVGVFWPVFDQTCRVDGKYNLQAGLLGVKDFICKLDGSKLITTGRHYNAIPYAQLVDYGNPESWLKYFRDKPNEVMAE